MFTEKKTILKDNIFLSLPKNLVFFDIETTGLKRETTLIYLIGCIFFDNNQWILTQWFNEDGTSEEEIISCFLNILSPSHKLVHYNGLTFDLPYINDKRKKYHLNIDIQNFEQFDLYRSFSTWKQILSLEKLRQIDMEHFFGWQRGEGFFAKELIKLYQTYLKTKKEVLLPPLFLHNKEDLLGLVFLFSCYLPYQNLREENIKIKEVHQTDNAIEFSFLLESPLINPLHIQKNDAHLDIKARWGILSIPKQKRELKYFYQNYREYYYLPMEDYAIHKSIAQFVDKEYKKKATAKECYQKKSSIFLPLPSNFPKEDLEQVEIFREEYKSTPLFIEDNPRLTFSFLNSYFHAFLKYLL